MDTNETNEPVGVEGATSSQDTSEDIAQTTETTQETISDSSEQVDVEEASEKLLAGKYKSPDELEKAYNELQSKLGEQGQKAELINLIEKQTGMNAQQIKDYLARQEEEQVVAQQQNDPLGYVMQRQQQLEAKLALQAEEKELDKFIQENPQYAPNRDKILKLGLNLERDKSYADIAKEYFGEAIAQGQQDAYKKIETKKIQSTGAISTPAKKFTLDDLKQMSSAEMEAILPHAQQ